MLGREQVQRKVYLFKAAAPEEEVVTINTSDTTLLSVNINNTTTTTPVSCSSCSHLLQQQPQQEERAEQQQETENDTTISADHRQDITLTTTSSTAPPQQRTVTTLRLLKDCGGDDDDGTTTTIITDHNNKVIPNKDRFITLLNSSKIENQLVPVLVFDYSNLDNLWRHLKRPAEHAGIIFTSPRCVQSIGEAIKAEDSDGEWEPGLRAKWESKYIFCVGPSTVSTATQLLPSVNTNLVITGLESHAESLANKIVEVNSEAVLNAPLLYPCGVQRRDVLLNKLKDENIACLQCTVYESVKNPALETALQFVAEEIKNYYRDQKEAVLVFFSPSGVKHVFQHLDPGVINHNQAKIVAIGPTTKTALQDYFTSKGINKLIYQCENPTPEALLEILS